jgi:hypothetical protein
MDRHLPWEVKKKLSINHLANEAKGAPFDEGQESF